MARETRHDPGLREVPGRHFFDQDAVERIPYMSPGLVTAEKAARGKLPTDVWWHTIVPTNGREKTGYPNQKPAGILRRVIQASSRPGDDRVLDFFAGSGTTGAVARELGRRVVLVDSNPEAIEVILRRLGPSDLRAVDSDGFALPADTPRVNRNRVPAPVPATAAWAEPDRPALF